ncbi:hypothetical protein ACQW5G_01345 [Fructilactobacillus sp. Tb1]|uniref:hypothetical protein n=1 Tax=Fructilactobacillus sp. Tb1 TaxID=3422304 RepID=UPI003D278FB8
MKYKVNDSKKLNELIAETGNTINSFSDIMHASSSYLKLVVNGKQDVFPPYAKRVIDLLNNLLELKTKEERLEITSIFFAVDVAKKKQSEKVS